MPPLGQLDPPPGVPAGAKGSDENYAPKLLEQTVWIAGSTVEVAFGIAANHGGGYQYRLCKTGSTLNEDCFHQTPLEFVGDKQWLQFGDGYDPSNREEIDAIRVGGDKVVPAGSTWTKIPIPGCMINGAREKKDCLGPTFPPPLATQLYHYSSPSNLYGIFGYGGGHCMGNQSKNPNVKCTDEEYKECVFDFGIVDLVKVPENLEPGHYVISFRWDCEQTKQIWSSCGDIEVRKSGQGTKAFAEQRGCTSCCGDGMCADCKDCRDDKTGDCAKCWEPREWWGEIRSWSPRSSHIQCLGYEAADGGAGSYSVGDAISNWSPGCSKCWDSADGGCSMHERELNSVAPEPTPSPTDDNSGAGDSSDSKSHHRRFGLIFGIIALTIVVMTVAVGATFYGLRSVRTNANDAGLQASLMETQSTGVYVPPPDDDEADMNDL